MWCTIVELRYVNTYRGHAIRIPVEEDGYDMDDSSRLQRCPHVDAAISLPVKFDVGELLLRGE